MSFFAPGSLRVKICGLTRADDATMAVQAGADALGFNFYSGSKRYLPFAPNRAWIEALAGQVDRVAVVVNPTRAEVDLLRDSGCFEAIQFHGDESPSDCAQAGFPRWIRAVRIKDSESTRDIARFETPWVLLDAFSSTAYGGTGQRLDWDAARSVVLAHANRQIVVAGGLTPDTIRDAVRIMRPFGVDVAGGVEIDPGRKDEYLVREFIRAAKEA